MSPSDKALFQEVAKGLSSGQDVGSMSRSLDLPATFLERLLQREDFRQAFATDYPDAFAVWEKARAEEAAALEVKTFFGTNAMKNAKAYQALLDDGDLKPAERLAGLEKALKMSGTVHEEAVQEVIKISAPHLAALIAADRETS